MAKSAVKRKKAIKTAVSIREMANDLAAIKADVAAIKVTAHQTLTHLDSLIQMAARAPSGQTLIALVAENNAMLHRLT
jgi:hypothetical protein